MTNKLFTSLKKDKLIYDEHLEKAFPLTLLFSKCLLGICLFYLLILVEWSIVIQSTLLANLQNNKRKIKSMMKKPYFYAHFNFHGITPLESRDRFLISILSGRVAIVTKMAFAMEQNFENIQDVIRKSLIMKKLFAVHVMALPKILL